MTTPKVGTIKRGGSRFYVHPTSREKVPGVTSVVGMLPKDFLKYWAAKLVAETAVENLGAVVSLALKDPSGAVDYLKRAPTRNTGEAADVGTEVHALVEKMAKGEKLGRVHKDFEPFVRGFREFLDEFKPKFLHLEQTVWNDAHGYAGSFDWIAELGDTPTTRRLEAVGEIILGDNKTTRSGVHAETAVQMAAYARGEYLLGADGTRSELPAVDGAAVLHLRPEGWQLVPVAITDEVFEIFVALRKVHDWDKEISKAVLGQPIAGRQFEVAS